MQGSRENQIYKHRRLSPRSQQTHIHLASIEVTIQHRITVTTLGRLGRRDQSGSTFPLSLTKTPSQL
jgi:hypothetical protein